MNMKTCAITLLCAGVIISNTALAETGKVKAVVSGDKISVEVNGETKEYRLYGVDAPEEGQTFAVEAKQFLGTKALNQDVQVEVVTNDAKGEPVVRVTLPDGQELNQEIIKSGFAWWDESNVPDGAEYQAANAEAIVAKTGLWQAGTALAPWDFRMSNKIESASYKPEDKTVKPEVKKEEPKVLAKKGDQVYTGSMIDASKFDPNEVKGLDPMSLMSKHQPRLAMGADGKPAGITADNISQLPYASAIGLQDGDVISSVNGISLTGGLPQIMSLIEQNKSNPPKTINVDIMRGGQNQTITINLP